MQSCHELIVWLVPLLDDFPRSRRFTLGERLETGFIDVLEALVEATYSRDKNAALTRANRQLEINRHLWRVAMELQVIPLKRFELGAKMMNELGAQIGGWLRSRISPHETAR